MKTLTHPWLWGGVLAVLLAGRAAGQVWTLTSAPFARRPPSVACSADGSRVLAAGNWLLYLSTNSGSTWAPAHAPATNYHRVASSALGDRLGVITATGAFLYSTNYGAAWALKAIPPVNGWQGYALACSADGKLWVVGDIGWVAITRDLGTTWQVHTNVGFAFGACWANGLNLAGRDGSGLYTSKDRGASWRVDPSLADQGLVAASADGSILLGTWHTWIGDNMDTSLWTSRDAGATWQQNGVRHARWDAMACSADGSKLLLVTYGNDGGARNTPIYTSRDSGSTWVPNTVPTNNFDSGWVGAASSADGNKLVVTEDGGGIYTWQTTPTPELKLRPGGTNLVLSWIVPSEPFVLQESSDLAAGPWMQVASSPSLNYTNLEYEVVVPKTQSARFYRLRSQSAQ